MCFLFSRIHPQKASFMVHPCIPEHIYQGTSWGSLEGPVAPATSWQGLQLLQQQRPESNSKKMMVDGQDHRE